MKLGVEAGIELELEQTDLELKQGRDAVLQSPLDAKMK